MSVIFKLNIVFYMPPDFFSVLLFLLAKNECQVQKNDNLLLLWFYRGVKASKAARICSTPLSRFYIFRSLSDIRGTLFFKIYPQTVAKDIILLFFLLLKL